MAKNPPAADKWIIKNERRSRSVLIDLNLFLTITIVPLNSTVIYKKMREESEGLGHHPNFHLYSFSVRFILSDSF